MTPFAKDKATQQKVTDSAAVLSGQELRGCPNENADQDILTIRSWAREAKEVIAFWQGYLSSDRDEPMDLIEANGLKMSMQSLRRILSRYLFGIMLNYGVSTLMRGRESSDTGFSYT